MLEKLLLLSQPLSRLLLLSRRSSRFRPPWSDWLLELLTLPLTDVSLEFARRRRPGGSGGGLSWQLGDVVRLLSVEKHRYLSGGGGGGGGGGISTVVLVPVSVDWARARVGERFIVLVVVMTAASVLMVLRGGGILDTSVVDEVLVIDVDEDETLLAHETKLLVLASS